MDYSWLVACAATGNPELEVDRLALPARNVSKKPDILHTQIDQEQEHILGLIMPHGLSIVHF